MDVYVAEQPAVQAWRPESFQDTGSRGRGRVNPINTVPAYTCAMAEVPTCIMYSETHKQKFKLSDEKLNS